MKKNLPDGEAPLRIINENVAAYRWCGVQVIRYENALAYRWCEEQIIRYENVASPSLRR